MNSKLYVLIIFKKIIIKVNAAIIRQQHQQKINEQQLHS